MYLTNSCPVPMLYAISPLIAFLNAQFSAPGLSIRVIYARHKLNAQGHAKCLLLAVTFYVIPLSLSFLLQPCDLMFGKDMSYVFARVKCFLYDLPVISMDFVECDKCMHLIFFIADYIPL